MNRPRQVRPAWLQRRQQLHELLEAGTHFAGNASVLEKVGADARVWSGEDLAAAWEAAPVFADGINHVYVHVPFCKSICHFCNYKRLRPGSAELMRRWADRMEESLAVLGPAVAKQTFHTLYFGGGTPSLLPRDLLARTLDAIDGALRFAPDAARFFEADPAVLDEGKLAVLRDHGFQHVAMGVQTLDPAVNASHDRGEQGPELIAKRVRQLGEAGIRSTSFDFLLGLHDTKPETIFAEVEQALADHRPRWVDLFFITPTQRYVDLHFDGSYDAFWTHQRAFADMASERLHAIGRRQGYRVDGEVYDAFVLTRRSDGGLASLPVLGPLVERVTRTVAKRPDLLGGLPRRAIAWLQRQDGSPYSYTHLVAEQHLPLHLLGLGTGARTRIFGSAFVVCQDPGDDPEREGPFEFVGASTDMAYEARAYLSDVLSTADTVPEAVLRRLFGVDLPTLLPETLGAWDALDVGGLAAGELKLAPTDREGRFRDLMWLLTDEQIEAELARIRRLDLSVASLEGLLEPLTVGQAVSEHWTLSAIEDAALRLSGPRGAVRVRVCPRLDRTSGLSLVPEGMLEGSDLTVAVSRLHKLMVRNGADELGITTVPTLRDLTFDGAGQHEAAPVSRDKRRRGPDAEVPAPVHDASADPPRPLSADAVQTWRAEGVVGPVPVLTPAEATRMRTWLELVEAEQAAKHGGSWTERGVASLAAGHHPLRAWAMELAEHPRVRDLAASAFGAHAQLQAIDVFVRAARSSSGADAHRDVEAQPDVGLTVWVALNPSTTASGCVRFAPGSHLDDGPPAAWEPMVLAVGEASVHEGHVLHASEGNRTTGRRIGVAVRFGASAGPPAFGWHT